jgi:hypothetical protein
MLNTKGKAKITEAHKPKTTREEETRVVADFCSLSNKNRYD